MKTGCELHFKKALIFISREPLPILQTESFSCKWAEARSLNHVELGLWKSQVDLREVKGAWDLVLLKLVLTILPSNITCF